MLLINLIQDSEPNKSLLINAKAPSEGESIFQRKYCVPTYNFNSHISTISFVTGDKTAVEALIVQFYQWEECARFAEKKTNAILDGDNDSERPNVRHKSNEEFIEETVAKCMHCKHKIILIISDITRILFMYTYIFTNLSIFDFFYRPIIYYFMTFWQDSTPIFRYSLF